MCSRARRVLHWGLEEGRSERRRRADSLDEVDGRTSCCCCSGTTRSSWVAWVAMGAGGGCWRRSGKPSMLAARVLCCEEEGRRGGGREGERGSARTRGRPGEGLGGSSGLTWLRLEVLSGREVRREGGRAKERRNEGGRNQAKARRGRRRGRARSRRRFRASASAKECEGRAQAIARPLASELVCRKRRETTAAEASERASERLFASLGRRDGELAPRQMSPSAPHLLVRNQRRRVQESGRRQERSCPPGEGVCAHRRGDRADPLAATAHEHSWTIRRRTPSGCT